jgi:hypothetical protein
MGVQHMRHSIIPLLAGLKLQRHPQPRLEAKPVMHFRYKIYII